MVEIQGHRGAKGLRPENTLSSIECALQVGVGSIECDVVLSADDAVVLSHDGVVHVHGVPASTVSVRSLPLSQLRELDRARPGRAPADEDVSLATLDQVLSLLTERQAHAVRLDVEIKSARHSDPHWDAGHVVQRVLEVIARHGAVDRCSVRSFDLQVLREARRRCAALRRCLLVGTVADRVPVDLATPAGTAPARLLALARDVEAFALAPGLTLVGRDLVDHAHEAGMVVVPWTVNDAAVLRSLVALGVDGVCTDRPDLVRRWLSAA